MAAELPRDRLAECLHYLTLPKPPEQAAAEIDAVLAAGKRADYLQVVNLTNSAAAGMLENVLQALKPIGWNSSSHEVPGRKPSPSTWPWTKGVVSNNTVVPGDNFVLDPQSFKASIARTEASSGLLTFYNALGELPKGFLAFEQFIPPPMTPEEKKRTRKAWIKDARDATGPIPDARPILDGDEFLDADKAWGLLHGVHSDLPSAGFMRTHRRRFTARSLDDNRRFGAARRNASHGECSARVGGPGHPERLGHRAIGQFAAVRIDGPRDRRVGRSRFG